MIISRLEVLIATRNSGKILEIQEALGGSRVVLRYLEDFPEVTPVEEIGETYRENAVIKAMNYSQQTGLCALADDSGLEVDALGGRPGIHSARFGGSIASDRERTEKLLATLSHCPDRKRTARFVCCMALAESRSGELEPSAGRVLSIAVGKCEGIITDHLRGTNGFGFDPVFVPAGYDTTFAEMPPKLKRGISHRAKALALIQEFLDHSLLQT